MMFAYRRIRDMFQSVRCMCANVASTQCTTSVVATADLITDVKKTGQ